MVIGTRLDEGALGAVRELTPDLRLRLTESGAVVVDDSDLERLNIQGVGTSPRSPAIGQGGGTDHGFEARRGPRLLLGRDGPIGAPPRVESGQLHPGALPQPGRRSGPWSGASAPRTHLSIFTAESCRGARACTG